jgi:hypothetical protein
MNAAGRNVCSGIHWTASVGFADPGAAPNFVREMGLRLRITSLTSNYDYDRIFDGRTIKGGIWIKSIKVYTVKMD